MSHFDGLINTTMPVADEDFVAEGNYVAEGSQAGLDEPPNVGIGYELVGRRTQPNAPIHMVRSWIGPTDEPTLWVKEHAHDYDEFLMWTGSDPHNPRDLGAEIYFDMNGERRTITTSGSIFIPAGVPHCPLGFIRIWRPFLFTVLSLAPSYAAKAA
ncbi:hypothetical protein [Labrys neptuniae]